MKKGEQELIFRKADEYLRTYGNLSIYDITQLFSGNYENISRIKKYLNSKNNYIDMQDNVSGKRQRLYYYKPLKTYTCKFCGQEFKSPSRQLFCKNECKSRYLINKEQEINFII